MVTHFTWPLAWWVIGVAGVAAVSIGFLLYPLVEEHAVRHFRTYVNWAAATREKMFRPVSKARIGFSISFSTLLAMIVGYLISRGNGYITVVFTALFAAVGWSFVRFWINFQWEGRLKRFDEQLIDGLNLLANSLKSGLNLQQAIQVLVKEMPNPLSQEFALVLSQEKLGLTTDEALERMIERIPSEDLSVALHSVLILRETGGDLSETFDTIASTIRERRKVDGKIKSMTAQGKMQGLVLFLLPFAFAAALYFINPEYITPLFTTPLGWSLLTVMVFLQILGGLWLRKIVKIDV